MYVYIYIYIYMCIYIYIYMKRQQPLNGEGRLALASLRQEVRERPYTATIQIAGPATSVDSS